MSPVDGVADLPGEPTVVSLSDVHGHRERFGSALLTLADHPGFVPVVERDGAVDGGLRWVGGEAYVLVVNGDVVDRGPDSAGCLDLVRRLQEQAPDSHVRFLAGNHELYVVYPAPPDWDRWWTATVDDDLRRRFYDRVLTGEVTVAFDRHEYTYVHAGAADGVDAAAVNEGFRAAAADLRERVGDDESGRPSSGPSSGGVRPWPTVPGRTPTRGSSGWTSRTSRRTRRRRSSAKRPTRR